MGIVITILAIIGVIAVALWLMRRASADLPGHDHRRPPRGFEAGAGQIAERRRC
jgi:hypothetical protein